MQTCYRLLLLILVTLPFVACNSPEVVHDLGDDSFALVDQDSGSVTFPGDFEGTITVIGFIYTHCPDVCPAITANLKNVDGMLEEGSDVRFLGVTFDPERDTPSVLDRYMEQFELDEERYTFVTGDTATVHTMLDALDIRARISNRYTTEDGERRYFMNHTNRISVLDRRGRVRLEYSGSYARPEQIVEGINRLR